MKKTLLSFYLFVFAIVAFQMNIQGQLVSSPFGWCTYGGSVTGGGNASSVTVSSNSAFRSAVSGSSSKVVYVSGSIDLGIANYCNVGSNTTIIGLGSNAKLIHGGLKLSGVSNIIIRNIAFQDARDPDWECETPTEGGQPSNCTASNADYDLCRIYGASRIWIDHCSFTNNQTTFLAYDGTCDITGGSDYVTISYCTFQNNHKGMSLIGGSDSDAGNYRITYAYNYISTDSRNPMVRFGRVHMLNNYYQNVSGYCIGVRINSRIFAEGNYFSNCKNPGDQADASGQIRDYGNYFTGCNPNSFDSPVSSVGWMPLGYYSYTALSASEVPSHVQSNAGPGKSLSGNSGGGSTTNGTVNGTYSIIASHSGKALDVYAWGTSNGTNICQWDYWGGATQQFNIAPVDGEWHRITPVLATDKALDIEGVSTASGANLFIWTYWGGNGQQFRFQSAGSGVWRIIARHSEKCLDVENFSTDNGANVMQWDCISGNNNQMFSLNRVSSANEITENNLDLKIYPNPLTSGNFTIQFNNYEVNANIDINIIDLQGRVIFNSSTNVNKEINVNTELETGTYILHIKTLDKNHVEKIFVL